jgi:transmembrane sensor
MGSLRRARKQISAEAVEWFLHFQDTTRSEQNRRAFSEWLLRSPAHVDEYLRVSCTWRALSVGNEGDLETGMLITEAKNHHELDNVVRLQGQFSPHSPLEGGESGHRFPRRGWAGALAASLVLGIGLWVAYVSWHSAMTFKTAVGEQRSFALQDGSVVFLNTNSEVRIRGSSAERQIDLVRGEARFKVAKDPGRPFTVATTKAAVRALGTLFNVRADPLSTQVAVLEGQVEVVVAARAPETDLQKPLPEGSPAVSSRALSSIRLAAGQRAAVTNLGIEANAGAPIESVMAWTERRLVFRDQPLSAVVREFNRYRMRPLVLDDPDLAALKISGVFDLSDPESLIAYLGVYEGVQVDRKADGSGHLIRRPAAVYSRK